MYHTVSMNFNIPKQILDIVNKFTKANYQIYIVGGAVRDLLMNRRINDWDLTTDAKPEEILKILPEGFYNNKFGTVGIGTTDKNSIIEITTMRKEGDYKDFRHPVEVSWTDKIEEDLRRRDFTINAIALTLNPLPSSTLIDPFDGQQDIKVGIVKTVGDPNQRFQEDALRLIRAARIANQLNFEIEQNTRLAVEANSYLLSEIAWERIRDELLKILATDNPTQGVILLKEVGLLKIILPELEDCFGIMQEGPKHDRVYDIGEHSLQTLKYTPSNDPLVRFAALLHDIGKVDTVKIAQDSNVTFYNHDIAGGKKVLAIAGRLHLSKIQTDKLYKLVRWHLFNVNENQTDSAIRRFIKNVGIENVTDMMILRIGDRLGGGTQKAVSWRMGKFEERIKQVLQKPFSITDLKVNGQDVMDILQIPSSRKIGKVLDQLFQEVLEDSSKNDREHLLTRITQLSDNQ